MLKLEDFQYRDVLITGGTGTFGRACVRYLQQCLPKTVIRVFSRDEVKQGELISESEHRNLVCMLGDVRDRDRLHRAMRGVDLVIHAAALKQVPSGERNPDEHVKTNVLGSMNVIEAAIQQNVKRVVFLSSDKAAAPVNLYGSTKLVSEKLFVGANHYSGKTDFVVTRYGNVMGSRGSVLELYKQYYDRREPLPVTDPGASRFWMHIDEAVELVLAAAMWAERGEMFVPVLPSFSMMTLIEAICGSEIDCYTVIGLRHGEKKHEQLLINDEVSRAYQLGQDVTGYSTDILSVMESNGVYKNSIIHPLRIPSIPLPYTSNNCRKVLSSNDIHMRLTGMGFFGKDFMKPRSWGC